MILMTAQEKKYWVAFSCFTPIGPKRFSLLLKYYGSAIKAWGANREELQKIGFKQNLINDFIGFRDSFDLSSYYLRLEKLGIDSITLEDKNYPENLKSIDGRPFFLYIIGQILAKDELAIGIVGTRKVTSYGRQITESLTADLVCSGLTIVSGLAMGIDTLAHLAAVSQKTRTIAILGSSIDSQSLFPPVNRKLAERIAQNGAALSEYPIGSFALKHHFPASNRIISGLSLGTLVIEAPEKSGAL